MNAKSAIYLALHLLKLSQKAVHAFKAGIEGDAYLGLGKAIATIESVVTIAHTDLEKSQIDM